MGTCFRSWIPQLDLPPVFPKTLNGTAMSTADNLKLDEATQKELATFLEREQAQARVQQSIHTFASLCWDKCITGTPSTRFSRGEETCLSSCVERFLDTSIFLVKRIEQQREAIVGPGSS